VSALARQTDANQITRSCRGFFWRYINSEGKPALTPAKFGWQHRNAEYISTLIYNPDGSAVIDSITFDIDADRTGDQWKNEAGKVDEGKVRRFLKKNYPDIFEWLYYTARSTGGLGLSIGLAVSPIQKRHCYDPGRSNPYTFGCAIQLQIIRLLNAEGIGADFSAYGLIRAVPNYLRTKEPGPLPESQARKIWMNRDIYKRIREDDVNVLGRIGAVTKKIKKCQKKIALEDPERIHRSKSTEKGMAKLFLAIHQTTGPVVKHTWELLETTGFSKTTLANILRKNPESCPPWLKSEYLGRGKGYRLEFVPGQGCEKRARDLVAGKKVKGPEPTGFLHDLPCPSLVESGNRNQWIHSAAIHYKWCGFEDYQAKKSLSQVARLIPGWEVSRNYKKIPQIVTAIYEGYPELAGIMEKSELPEVLTVSYFQGVKKQQRPPGTALAGDRFEGSLV